MISSPFNILNYAPSCTNHPNTIRNKHIIFSMYLKVAIVNTENLNYQFPDLNTPKYLYIHWSAFVDETNLL